MYKVGIYIGKWRCLLLTRLTLLSLGEIYSWLYNQFYQLFRPSNRSLHRQGFHLSLDQQIERTNLFVWFSLFDTSHCPEQAPAHPVSYLISILILYLIHLYVGQHCFIWLGLFDCSYVIKVAYKIIKGNNRKWLLTFLSFWTHSCWFLRVLGPWVLLGLVNFVN